MRLVIVGAHLRREDVEPVAEAVPVGDLFLSGVPVADDQPLGDRDLLLRVARTRAQLLERSTFIAIRYGFAIGSPLFPVMTIHLENGHSLHILGQGAADDAPYVQSLTLNGQAYNTPWIAFRALMNGATLQFTLDKTPHPAALSSPINQNDSGG